mgnify:CR=1 FL=1
MKILFVAVALVTLTYGAALADGGGCNGCAVQQPVTAANPQTPEDGCSGCAVPVLPLAKVADDQVDQLIACKKQCRAQFDQCVNSGKGPRDRNRVFVCRDRQEGCDDLCHGDYHLSLIHI